MPEPAGASRGQGVLPGDAFRSAVSAEAPGGSNIGYANGNWSGTMEGNFLEQGLGQTGLDTSGFEITDVAYDANTGWTGAVSNEFGTVNQDGQYSATVIPDDGDESSTWPAVQEVATDVKTTVSDLWTSIFGGEKPVEEQPQVVVVEEGTTPNIGEAAEEKKPEYVAKEYPVDLRGLAPSFTVHFDQNYRVASVTTKKGDSACTVLPPGTPPNLTVRCTEGPNTFEADLVAHPRSHMRDLDVVQSQLRLPLADGGGFQAMKDGDIVQMDGAGKFALIPATAAGSFLSERKDMTVYVDGMNNHEVDFLANLKATSTSLGVRNVYGVYVSRVGGVEARSLRNETLAPPSLKTLEGLLAAQSVKELVGYSLGGAISARALKNMQTKNVDVTGVTWVTVTGAQTRQNLPRLDSANRPGRVVVIAGKNDAVNGGHYAKQGRSQNERFVCNLPGWGCDKEMYDHIAANQEYYSFVHEEIQCNDPNKHSFAECYAQRFLAKLRRDGTLE